MIPNVESEKFRILINGPLPPPWGGMQTYCQDFLRSPLTKQFNIRFCRAILLPSVFETHGLLRFALRCLNSFLITLVWVGQLLVYRPHIAHVHTNSYSGFYVKGLLTVLARLSGAKTIFHIHGGAFKKFYGNAPWFMRALIRWMININSAVIVLSKEWKQYFASIGVDTSKLIVLTNSVFVPDLTEKTEKSSEVTVLFLNRLEKDKGVYELVEAIDRNRNETRSCRYILAGPKAHRWQAVDEKIRQLNLNDCVQMPGAVFGDAKDEIYRKADIYVLPSYIEGMPIGLLEAMSYGLACITTPVGGIPDIVDDGRNALLVKPGDVGALAESLKRLILDSQLRKRLGEEARATVVAKYNWQQRASEIAQLYSGLIKGGKLLHSN
jgi:glycosyltransferase involved in cell wall biosynthesis